MNDVDNHLTFRMANYHAFMMSLNHLSLYYLLGYFQVNLTNLRTSMNIASYLPVAKSLYIGTVLVSRYVSYESAVDAKPDRHKQVSM